MKRAGLALLLLLCFAAAQAQEKVGDTLVQKVFRSLRQGDETSFITLFPNYQQWRRFVQQMLTAEVEASAKADTTIKNTDSIIRSYMNTLTEEAYNGDVRDKFTESFHSVYDEGKEKGFNWQKAVLTSYTLDTAARENEETEPPSLQGKMMISDGRKKFTLSFNDIVWMEHEGGWFGISLKGLADLNNTTSPGEKDEEVKPASLQKKKPTAPSSKPAAKKTSPVKKKN